ncbi:MAG: hypothetical protein RI911_939 [Candidatus Parcubacteria bacterium]|jgi:hypothetical protein
MDALQKRIEAIEERNARVSADKRWETSTVRRSTIAGLVFVTAWAWLTVQGSETALRDALFPPLGYVLSTIALSRLQVQWEAPQKQHHD